MNDYSPRNKELRLNLKDKKVIRLTFFYISGWEPWFKIKGSRLSLSTSENIQFIFVFRIHILLGFSQLYMVTILRRRQEERNATRFKMLFKKTYIYIEREERKYCLCKQFVCGKLFPKRRPFNSLYFRCPFGWVEENRVLFLVLRLLGKMLTSVY